MTVKKRRTYRSELRSEQAAATRARILEAARNALAVAGVSGVTMEEVAQAARVSVPTVYAIHGNKQRLLREVLEGIGRAAGLGDRVRQILETSDSCTQLAMTASLSRHLWERAAGVLRGIRTSAAGDRDVADWWRDIENERLAGQRPLIVALERRGDLREELTVDVAADLLVALSGPSFYLLLTDERGWPARRYEQWLASGLQQVLLRNEVRCRSA